MKISYCTTCMDRLWQLETTLKHNVSYLRTGETELCILAYNDPTVLPFIKENYPEYLEDQRIRVVEHTDTYEPVDGSNFACGYVKNLSHRMARGEVLFNLDADNFITDRLESELLNLKRNEVLAIHPVANKTDGRSGRIGVHAATFKRLTGYKDVGRKDDIDFMYRAAIKGCSIVYTVCDKLPIPNSPPRKRWGVTL